MVVFQIVVSMSHIWDRIQVTLALSIQSHSICWRQTGQAAWGSRVVQWSKILHFSAKGSLQYLVQIQAALHLAVIGSPIGQCAVGPVLSGFGWGRLSL